MLEHVDWNKEPRERDLTFWASSSFSMNDPQEFVYGYKLLQKAILPDIEKELGIEDDTLKLSRLWKIFSDEDIEKWNNALLDKIYKEQQIPFIVSFSRCEDYLPMWNAYADRGKGVCLCFNNSDYEINDIYDFDNINIIPYLHAKDVSYGCVDDVIRNAVLSLYKREIEKNSNEDEIARKQKMLSLFATLAVTISPYHKHKAYEYEDEVRLVQFKESGTDVKYRVSKSGRLIPYIEVPMKLNYLQKIIVGPCADSQSIIRELRIRFHEYMNGNEDFIVSSEVPYRDY